jgi:aspartate/methionine/tyrosine aminotransferase
VRLRAQTLEQIDSPISATYALLAGRANRRPLIDLAQAAPTYPPAPSVIEHIVAVAQDARGAGYVELSGLPELRAAFADELSRDYAGRVDATQVLPTAGCNQAFCVVTSSLAGPGDEVILPLPYYFNHDMWLRLQGITPVYLEPDARLVPRAADAERLITARTRAIVLVTPGNPSGVTVDPDGIADFAALARRHRIALIVDETYRSFRDTDQPAHRLFADPDWARTVVSLHSFSKDLALPGYRVGAVVAAPELIREAMKVLDCVAICPPRVGQEAAWAGLTGARQWRRDRAQEVAERRAHFVSVLSERPGGYELLSSGGFFVWVRHPFPGRPTADVVAELVTERDVLVIPGTAFGPDDRGTIRVSFANADHSALSEFGARIAENA